VRVPGGFVGHDRRIDRPSNFGQPFDAHHRLLDILQTLLRHFANDGDGFAWRLVALVRIDADVDVFARRHADRFDDLDVAPGVDANFVFDRPNPPGRDLPCLFLGLCDRDQPDRMGNRHARSDAPAEENVNWYSQPAPSEIVEREFDRGFGVGIAFDHRVHARMKVSHISEVDAGHGRRQIVSDYATHDEWRLTEITAEFAAPVLERWRLTPTASSVAVGHPR